MEKLKKILEIEIAQRELALKHNPLNKEEIRKELTELQEGLVKLFTTSDVVGQSKQFCDCDIPLIRTSDKGGEYCGLCQKDLY